jgi:quercetin dioxygenase-like cupin family protein
MASKAVAKAQGESQAIWMLGGLYEVLVSSDESGGKATVIEFTVPVGAAPPLHMHDCDETVYVIEGTLKYHLDGKTIDGGPGSVFHIPAGTKEFFEPTSLLKIIGIYHGGSMDKFFAEAGEPAQKREVPPPPSAPPDVERLAEIGARHGLTLVPPA